MSKIKYLQCGMLWVYEILCVCVCVCKVIITTRKGKHQFWLGTIKESQFFSCIYTDCCSKLPPPLCVHTSVLSKEVGKFLTQCYHVPLWRSADILFRCRTFLFWGTKWRSCLKHCATSRKVAVFEIFNWLNTFGRTVVLRSTQPLR